MYFEIVPKFLRLKKSFHNRLRSHFVIKQLLNVGRILVDEGLKTGYAYLSPKRKLTKSHMPHEQSCT